MGNGFVQKYKHALLAALLALAAVITFSNSLHNDFMMDDFGLILQESRGHNASYLWEEFVPDYRRSIGVRDMPDNVYYRPWAHVIPLGCYAFFQDRPFGYHIVNLVLFWLAGLCIYAFILFLFKDLTLALLTALLFIVHPINGLAVNYITASVFSWQVIAMMLGLMAAIRRVDSGPCRLWLVLGLFGFINALMCHESALAFPFYLTACLLIVRRLSWRQTLKFSWPFWAFSAAYFVIRLSYASLKVSILDKVTGIAVDQYLATFPKLVLWYLKALVSLDGIVLIWSTPIVKTQTGIWMAVLAALILAAVVLIIRLRKTPHALWPLWLMIAFLPVTLACFFQPRSGLMIEPHWLIIGSVGYCAGISALLLKTGEIIRKKYQWALVILFVLSLIIASRQYNRLWGSEQQYCRYWFQQTPHLKSILFYLAGTYARTGDLDQAKSVYTQALEGVFLDYEIFNNLGLIAVDQNDLKTARENFLTALQIHPASSVALTNLGAIALKSGDMPGAQGYFHSALDSNPYLTEARINLAGILQKQGRLPEAVALYEENDRIDPLDEKNLYEWLAAVVGAEDGNQVEKLADRLLKVSADSRRLTETGSLLAQNGFFALAGLYFEKALVQDPQYKEAYLEAGKMLANLGDARAAVVIWQDGLEKFPGDQVFSDLIRQIKKQ